MTTIGILGSGHVGSNLAMAAICYINIASCIDSCGDRIAKARRTAGSILSSELSRRPGQSAHDRIVTDFPNNMITTICDKYICVGIY